MSTSIVLLAYKEAENLKILLPKINSVCESMNIDYEIVVIDAAKPLDNSREICDKNNARYMLQEEPCYAGAFRTGIRHAACDRILVMDADGSHDPSVIPDIHNKFKEGYDMVIGSRYVKGGRTNDSFSSFLMSKLLNTTMRICIGVKAKDISTSFRLYNTKQLKDITLTRNNYDVLQEVILRLKINKNDFRIGEVPIVFEKRLYGESKRKLFKFILGYLASIFMLLSIRIKALFRK